MSADERRLSVLHAARIEFGSAGYSAATTDAIGLTQHGATVFGPT